MPLGALLGLARFPGRSPVIVLINALMGLPPVVAGLVIFLLLSRSGPLGILGWLFTPKAMILAQTILVLPIVIALTRQIVEDLWAEYGEHLTSLGQTGLRAMPTLLWDARFSLATPCSRASGAPAPRSAPCSSSAATSSATRESMTTSIALETSRRSRPRARPRDHASRADADINAAAFGASRVGARYAGAP